MTGFSYVCGKILITIVVVSASVIMNEGIPDELRHEMAREFYHFMKEG